MRQFRVNRGLLLLVPAVCWWSVPAAAQGALKPIAATPQVLDAARQLQLSVSVNGEELRLVEPFTLEPTENRFSAKRSDLQEAAIKTPAGPADEVLFLDDLGVKFAYDEAGQKMEFTLTDDQRLPRSYNTPTAAERPKPRSDLGAIVNYSIFGGSIRDMNTGKLQFSGANAQLDARVFSELGLLQQTGVVGATLVNSGGTNNFLRLDTTYSFSNPDTTMTYRAGDMISGATSWSRPVHMGGAQVMRDFTLRSDVVTQPLPIVSGTAATPSTVDILVNGSKTFSQQVGSGPFTITNLPINASGGTAQVVIQDATGRTTRTTLSLFNPAKMLAAGLTDFSLEGGLARRNYGLLSNDYYAKPIGSGTFRYGLNQWLTLESHAEGGAGLANAGFGALVGLGGLGTTNIAVSASHSANGSGGQVYLDWQLGWRNLTFSIGTQRTFGNYDDLASVTANLNYNPVLQQSGLIGVLPTIPTTAFVSPRVPRASDRLAVSMPVFDDKSSLSLGAINLVQQNKVTSRLLTASFSRALAWRQATVFATSYADFGTTKSFGAFAGLTIPIWDGAYSSTGASYDRSAGASFTAQASKAQQSVDNSYGWNVRSGIGQSTFGEVGASYRTSVGQAAATLAQNKQSTVATGQFDGSIAAMGGGVFMGNKVDSSFAVVDAGAPGVTVLQDSRAVGKTGQSGKLLVTNLRDWDSNNISIDPEGAPLTFDAARTNEIVAPRRKTGVYLNFGGRANVASAIVVFSGADGKPVGLGSQGHLEGSEETFLVGRDGRAYVKDLAADNVAIIDLGDRQCRASFAYAPVPGRQGLVKGVSCQ